MKRTLYWLLSLVMVLGMLLSACAPEATTEAPVVVDPTVAPTEPPVEPTEISVVESPDLNTAFDTFLAGMEAYQTIGLEALNEALAAETPPFVVDVRTVGEVEDKGHIPGAIVIPLAELAENLDKLPSFDTPIVTYCGSGWRCTIAATALAALGWEDVTCLKGKSFTGWVDAGYAVEPGLPADAEALNAATPDAGLVAAIADMLSAMPEGYGGINAEALNTALGENSDLVVIDVRRFDEVEEKGQIDAPNLIHIPLEDFVVESALWPADLDTPITVYCGSGHRSTIAMTILWTYGYTNVTSLKDGFGGWVDAGYGVIGGMVDLDGAFGAYLDGMEKYQTIGLDDLNTMLAEDTAPFIVDVRTVGEVEEKGHIPGAILIPLAELTDNLDKLPSFDTTIVTYCGSGWRCTIASAALGALGWEDVKCLKGSSFTGWVENGFAIEAGLPVEAETLNAAMPDAALVAAVADMLANLPQGYGGITADNLNLALAESPDLILIDVRRDDVVTEKGVIESANFIHIPLEQFVAMQDMWPADMDAQIVVYCGSGHRSTIAMTILWTYGYTNVSSLKDGFGGWVEAGYPVVVYAAPMAVFFTEIELV